MGKLLFFGSRVLPVVCLVGAAQLIIVNTIFPMSEEERRELERIRAERGAIKPEKIAPLESAQSIPSLRNPDGFKLEQDDSRDLEGFKATEEDIVKAGSATADSFK